MNTTCFLQQRQHLLHGLVQLGRPLLAVPPSRTIALSRFCDQLIDYLSRGHFQVYSRCAARSSITRASHATTEDAMAFAERYGSLEHNDWSAVRVALNQLALTLETRFELEDVLLAERTAMAG